MSLFTLDGRSLDEFGLIAQPGHQHAMLPATVERKLMIPGMHGTYDFGATLAERFFSFPLAFAKELNRVELQQRMRVFSAFLLNGYGKPRELKLIFQYEPGVFYLVKFTGSIDPERIFALGFFTLQLVASKPFAQGVENIIEETIIASPHTIQINSAGNVQTDLVIVITNISVQTMNGFTLVNEYEID